MAGLCAIDGCERVEQLCRGWCRKHYQRWLAHGDPQLTLHRPEAPCDVDGCDEIHIARGWCVKHYDRWRKHGDPTQVLPRSNQNVAREECRRGHPLVGDNLYEHPTGRRVCLQCRDEYGRKWRRENRERIRELARRRREEDPHKAADYTRRYRARKAGAVVEDVDRAIVWERDQGTCGICDERIDPADFEVDHVIPLSRGGEESYANVQASHRTCNRRKGDRLMSELSDVVRGGVV